MRLAAVLHVLFVLYCLEAGLFFVVAPWTPGWDAGVLRLPTPRVAAVLFHPLMRGAVTGVGLVHIVWGTHDLLGLLFGKRRLSGEPAP